VTEPSATTRFTANPAPEDLRVVQDLANTLGVGSNRDILDSAETAHHWLESALGAACRGLRPADIARIRSLRGSVRSALHGSRDEASEHSAVTLTIRLGREGIAVQPSADPVETLEAQVAYALTRAEARGDLSRLKLCANPRCEVAFFDVTRNGTGRWHSPTTCGNSARVRAHRDRAHQP